MEIAKIAGYRFDDLLADANPIHSARTRFVEGPMTLEDFNALPAEEARRSS